MGAKKARPSSGGGRLPRWTVVFLLVVFAIVVASILFANPPFPDVAELNEVKLDPPPRPPVSAALKALLASPRHAELPPRVALGSKQLSEGEWPEKPAEIVRALDALRPPLEESRAALLAPGCHPEEELKASEEPKPSSLSYINLIRGSKLLTLQAVARAATEGPAAPGAALAALHRRLLELERCSPGLVAAMVLHAAVGILDQGLVFLLAHPALSEESSRTIWERLLASETRRSPMPDAVRWEVRYQRGLVDAIERGDHKNQGGPPLAWPWYSRESTLKLLDQLGRRAIWLAERPLTDVKAWTARFPEEKYFDKLQRQPGPLTIFRHNAIGKVLVGIGPDLRKFVLKWEKGRCLDAARRARLVRELRARGARIPDAVLAQPARDRRTGAPFTGTELGWNCGLRHEFTRGDRSLSEGARTRPLAPPPATPASAPTPEPPAR